MMIVWVTFAICMTICYVSSWLLAKDGGQGPVGQAILFCQRFIPDSQLNRSLFAVFTNGVSNVFLFSYTGKLCGFCVWFVVSLSLSLSLYFVGWCLILLCVSVSLQP